MKKPGASLKIHLDWIILVVILMLKKPAKTDDEDEQEDEDENSDRACGMPSDIGGDE